MKIVKVSAIPMSAPVPEDKRHRTDLGTKVKSDATLIRVETDDGLTGIGAALGTPPIVAVAPRSRFLPDEIPRLFIRVDGSGLSPTADPCPPDLLPGSTSLSGFARCGAKALGRLRSPRRPCAIPWHICSRCR